MLKGRVEYFWQRSYVPQTLKVLLFVSLQDLWADPFLSVARKKTRILSQVKGREYQGLTHRRIWGTVARFIVSKTGPRCLMSHPQRGGSAPSFCRRKSTQWDFRPTPTLTRPGGPGPELQYISVSYFLSSPSATKADRTQHLDVSGATLLPTQLPGPGPHSC